jgi:hypothetical protein
VHLTRWTRQSQAGLSIQHLAQLLLIAEEEAVVAVVHSPALTDELARYAWWCMPTIENARLMLMRDVVCQGRMGRTLAEFLVDHLAFLHEDDVGILDTVAVMLYSGVLTDAERLSIWKRGNSRNSYYVAFLELQPDNLPSPRAARADHASVPQLADNPYCAMLDKALSGQGQTFIATTATILERPENQEVVNHRPTRPPAVRRARPCWTRRRSLKRIAPRSTHWPRWTQIPCGRSSSRPPPSAP